MAQLRENSYSFYTIQAWPCWKIQDILCQLCWEGGVTPMCGSHTPPRAAVNVPRAAVNVPSSGSQALPPRDRAWPAATKGCPRAAPRDTGAAQLTDKALSPPQSVSHPLQVLHALVLCVLGVSFSCWTEGKFQSAWLHGMLEVPAMPRSHAQGWETNRLHCYLTWTLGIFKNPPRE